MHAKSSLLENVDLRECTLNLRNTAKVNIKTAFTAKTRVYNSPLYRTMEPSTSRPTEGEQQIRFQKENLQTFIQMTYLPDNIVCGLL